MFKGFQNTSRSNGFNGFPALNFQMNNEAYGFSGCTFWLDAAYGLNTQADSASVSSWQSRIGGVTFTQSTAATQPIFVLASTSFNNLPAVYFDTPSAPKFMSLTNQFVSFTEEQMTLVVVYKYLNISTGFSTYKVASILTDSNFLAARNQGYQLAWRSHSTTNVGLWAGSDNQVFTSSEPYSTNSTILIITKDKMMYNNTLVSSINQIANRTAGFFTNINGNGSAAFSGEFIIPEVLIFNRMFSDDEMSSISNRLNTKYVIY
jgi:hypothetical protein